MIALNVCFGHSTRTKPPLKCFTNAGSIEVASSANRRHGIRLRLDDEAGHTVLDADHRGRQTGTGDRLLDDAGVRLVSEHDIGAEAAGACLPSASNQPI